MPLGPHDETALAMLVQALTLPSVLIEHRRIAVGDENGLLPDEQAGFANAIASVRRQSAAARVVARGLLARLDIGPVAIARTSTRAPIWPAGITGSLAHDDEVAIAAIARTSDVRSIGIDIEPDEPLPADLAGRIATVSESHRYGHAIISSRQLFVVKEAVFKAVHPIDGMFLDFGEIEVDLEAGIAHVSGGRRVAFRLTRVARVAALAVIAN